MVKRVGGRKPTREKVIDALVKSGYYSSKSDVLKGYSTVIKVRCSFGD